jgi:hypothetical protein
VNSDALTLVRWKQRSGWPSTFDPLRREIGDTNIVTLQAARNLQVSGLVDIVGPAEVAVPKVCETLNVREAADGSVPSDDPLSPTEG